MEPDRQPIPRVRKIDWLKVLEQCDTHGSVFVGVVDQSMRTHIRKGRFSYIDPAKYDVWTESHEGSRTQARLYMSKRAT